MSVKLNIQPVNSLRSDSTGCLGLLAARPAQRSSRLDEFRFAHSCQNPLTVVSLTDTNLLFTPFPKKKTTIGSRNLIIGKFREKLCQKIYLHRSSNVGKEIKSNSFTPPLSVEGFERCFDVFAQNFLNSFHFSLDSVVFSVEL